MAFKAHGHLKDHVKIHNNERPFKCNICEASFARSSTLKIHSHTHSGLKPHRCLYRGCNKTFSERGNMKTHMKIHYKKQKKPDVDKITKLDENSETCNSVKVTNNVNTVNNNTFLLNANETTENLQMKNLIENYMNWKSLINNYSNYNSNINLILDILSYLTIMQNLGISNNNMNLNLNGMSDLDLLMVLSQFN